nr:MAG TPA: hypothetical protein [Caudoviricetes sp.]
MIAVYFCVQFKFFSICNTPSSYSWRIISI